MKIDIEGFEWEALQGGRELLAGARPRLFLELHLNELEQRLDPARFFRISRAALINLSAVTEVHPLPGGSGEVVLKNGQKLEVTRRRFRDLLHALEGV